MKMGKLNFKFNKTIYKVTGLLLVTLLFVTSLFNINNLNNISYAAEYKENDILTIKVGDDFCGEYILTGEYDGTNWNLGVKNEIIGPDGNKVEGSTLYEVLVNACLNSSSQDSYNDVLKEVLEVYALNYGDGNNTITGNYYEKIHEKGTATKEVTDATILSASNGQTTWERIIDGYLSNKYAYEYFYNVNLGNALKGGLKINSLALTDAFYDNYFFEMMLNTQATSHITKEISNESGYTDKTDISLESVGTSYSAKFEILDTEIHVVISDVSGNEVTRFYFADMIGTDSYKERTYNNTATNKVNIAYKNSIYSLSARETNKDDSKNCYYLIENSNFITIDTYYDMINACEGTKTDLINPAFVLMKDDSMSNLILYSASEGKDKSAELNFQVKISLDEIETKFTQEGISVTSGEWRFEVYSGSTVVAYKKDEENILNNGYFYDFGTLKRMYVKGKQYANIFIPVKKGVNSDFSYGYPTTSNTIFLIIKCNNNFTEKDKDSKLTDIRAEIAGYIKKDGYQLLGITGTIDADNGDGAGSSTDNKLDPNAMIIDGNEPNGKDFPPSMPLNQILQMIPNYEEIINGTDESITVDTSADIGLEKTNIKNNFIKDVLKYGKVILMVGAFAMIIYIGLMSIYAGNDAQDRAKIKTALMNVIKGVLIFACIAPIFKLIMDFATNSYAELAEIAESYQGPTYNATITRYTSGWLVSLIGSVIDVITHITHFLTKQVLAVSIEPGQTTSLGDLIYGVTDSSDIVSSYKPFTSTEWVLYMQGYKLLTSLAIAIIGFALVKASAEALLGSGNYEKMTEVKESIKRAIYAVLGIVFAPYAFRLLLLLFNYLTAMLPIDGNTVTFDIDFGAAGFVGSVANLTFETTTLRIFIAFLVRKVMLVVMLVATPVLLAIWAVDKKFRGISLWIGEIFSNVSMQFCYALVFLVVILVNYEGQNPFVALIIVCLVPKLANFFSKSLQGLAQRWGGVGSESVAGEIVNFIKKGKQKTKGAFNKTGRVMTKVAKRIDPKGISKEGRNLHNVGAILQGNFLDVQTHRELMKNKAKAASQFDQDAKLELKRREEEFKPFENDVEFANYKKEIDNAQQNYGYIPSKMKKTGTGYDQANALVEQKQEVEISKYRKQGLDKLADTYYKDYKLPNGKTIGEIVDSDSMKDKKIRRWTTKFIAMGPVSALQRIADRGVGNGLDRVIQTQNGELFKAKDLDVNVSDVIDNVCQMKQEVNSFNNKTFSGKQNFKVNVKNGQNNVQIDADKVIKQIESMMKNDNFKTPEKAKAYENLMHVANQYKSIISTNEIELEGILESQRMLDEYKEEAESDEEKGKNTQTKDEIAYEIKNAQNDEKNLKQEREKYEKKKEELVEKLEEEKQNKSNESNQSNNSKSNSSNKGNSQAKNELKKVEDRITSLRYQEKTANKKVDELSNKMRNSLGDKDWQPTTENLREFKSGVDEHIDSGDTRFGTKMANTMAKSNKPR